MLAFMGEPLEELQTALHARWQAINRARVAAMSERLKLGELLRDIGTTDAAIVAYGSLARGEWTAKSDVDWTLLVDGPAKPDQRGTAHDIKRVLTDAQVNAPNAAGAFGAMSFSNELVHRIGGDADTNRITTQRVLLLLESVTVRPQDAPVHERVIRAVLNSYLEHYEEGITRHNVPRFLLNDVVRY